jgi:hypothetical protein
LFAQLPAIIAVSIGSLGCLDVDLFRGLLRLGLLWNGHREKGFLMAVTYYVALPFIRTEDGTAPGEAQERQSEGAAVRRAEGMSRDPAHARAVVFKRTGDPNVGEFSDAVVLKKFGDVPEDLSEL